MQRYRTSLTFSKRGFFTPETMEAAGKLAKRKGAHLYVTEGGHEDYEACEDVGIEIDANAMHAAPVLSTLSLVTTPMFQEYKGSPEKAAKATASVFQHLNALHAAHTEEGEAGSAFNEIENIIVTLSKGAYMHFNLNDF